MSFQRIRNFFTYLFVSKGASFVEAADYDNLALLSLPEQLIVLFDRSKDGICISFLGVAERKLCGRSKARLLTNYRSLDTGLDLDIIVPIHTDD